MELQGAATGQGGLVLVTGANGFIAGHMIAELQRRGFEARGTLRSLDKADAAREAVEQAGGEGGRVVLYQASLDDDAGWAEAVKDCDYLLHLASPFPLSSPKTLDEIVRPARDGALRALKAAQASGVKRAVLTSSCASVMYGLGPAPGRVFSETDWSNPDGPNIRAYAISKTLAERAAWEFAVGSGLELSTVLPGLVLGPVLRRDHSSSIDVFRRLFAREIPGAPAIGYPCVDVRDVTDLHIRAMTNPKAKGNRFIASEDFYWLRDLALLAKQAFPKRRIPTGALPNFMVRFAALSDKDIKDNLFELGVEKPCSSKKARQWLDWSPRPMAETVRDTGQSLIDLGVVKS